MKPIYKLEQRLAFITRNEAVFDGKTIHGPWKYCTGYVKQIRRSVFGVRYVIQLPKTSDVHIVPQRDIMGVAEYRDSNSNKQIKSNDNGNI